MVKKKETPQRLKDQFCRLDDVDVSGGGKFRSSSSGGQRPNARIGVQVKKQLFVAALGNDCGQRGRATVERVGERAWEKRCRVRQPMHGPGAFSLPSPCLRAAAKDICTSCGLCAHNLSVPKMNADPFYTVKEEVQARIASTRTMLDRHKKLVSLGQASGNPEFDKLNAELKKAVKTIEWDLNDLEETVSIVENDRRKFRITDDELRSRKSFVAQTRSFAQEVQSTVLQAAGANRSKLTAAAVGSAAGAASGAEISMADHSDRFTRAADDDNSTFLRDETQKQDQLMRDQDQDLEALSTDVQRLHGMGQSINDELQQQNRMVEDLDREVDSTMGRLKANMAKAARVLKDSKDKGKMFIIIILGIILLVLVILMIKFGNKN